MALYRHLHWKEAGECKESGAAEYRSHISAIS